MVLICLFLVALAIAFFSAAQPPNIRWPGLIIAVVVATLVALTWARVIPA